MSVVAADLVVAGLSARMLAESARAGGYRALALDLFGDLDTRAAAHEWRRIGDASRLLVDETCLLTALDAARAGGAIGWVAGSGFEGRSELLDAGQKLLPLIGNSPQTVRRLRDPQHFFATLAQLGIPHPAVSHQLPAGPGWLAKDAWASGGWHVRRCAAAPEEVGSAAAAGRYYQREAPGIAMSVLFLAGSGEVRMLGFNRQRVRPLGGHPFVHRGCIGPRALPAALAARIEGMLVALSAAFELKGLNGLDFLLDGAEPAVLELNPRPTASMALHGAVLPGGLMRAHLAACRGEPLPAPIERGAGQALHGFEVVFARRAGRVAASAVQAMAAAGWCHDRPAEETRFGWGDPLCSVSASGPDEASVEAQLAARRRSIHSMVGIGA